MATTSRVDDYLGDKIQTAADLGAINELLAKIREQQHLLRDQLTAAKSDHLKAENAAHDLSRTLRERTTKFQREQVDIDRRLQILTQSNVSDDAVRIFESQLQRIGRLDTATGFLEILREVDDLFKSATAQIDDPVSALAKYTRLRTLYTGLRHAQRAAEEAAPHLIDQVGDNVQKLYKELKQRLDSALQKTLERMQWPKKDLKLLGNVVETWSDQVGRLLDLQEAEVKADPDTFTRSSASPILLPLEVMVRPLALRFRYHFYGDRPTNRLDKPEYFFSHVLDLIEQLSPFVSQLLQPILDVRTQKSEVLELHYTDTISSLITALLPMVLAKSLSVLPQITAQPQLLSHFMHELMSFDNTLRDSWAYIPVAGVFVEWKGLTGEILNQHGYFQTWLDTEKSFALSRYKKIRDSLDSNQIDYDTVEPSKTKPTKGALRVIDLLETVTDRYRLLPSFSQKITFFLDIQLAVFDDYHGHLHGALQAYLMTSHTAGRLIQGGGQSQDDVMGIKGLESLVKIFGSADYLERKMSDWSEDIFFLELWDELEDRAKRGGDSTNGTVGQNLTIDDVASKTSVSIRPNASEAEHDIEGGALFDEISKTYRRLREQAENEIVRALETQARNALKGYARVSIWASLSTSASDVSDLTPSSSLDTLLSTLSVLLAFLANALAVSPFRRITRPLCTAIQKELIDTVIMKHTFSVAGALQLQRDIIAIQDVIDSNLCSAANLAPGTFNEASRNMKKLGDALAVLNLPVKQTSGKSPSRSLATTDAEGEEPNGESGWGFDDDDEAEQSAINETQKGEDSIDEFSWDLWAFEKAIFASNESAREALAAMHLDELTESEARNMIRRRAELNA